MFNKYRNYLLLLALIILGWSFLERKALWENITAPKIWAFIPVLSIYLAAHLTRMLRLALLSLNQRKAVMPLIAAHALTAFPSNLIPFKLGEVIRLCSFSAALQSKRKAFSLWFTERLGDISVLTLIILAFYVLKIDIPNTMRSIFILFVALSLFSFLGIFAITKLFTFLSRYLVLESTSNRGLKLLKASYFLREIERDIHESMRGRFIGFMLLTLMIWILEIVALSLFLKLSIDSENTFSELLMSGFTGSLFNSADTLISSFGVYQSFGLALISLASISLVFLFSLKKTHHSHES
jgi:hypothetical protein